MTIDNFYDDLKRNPNNISYWFPKVKDCGIPVPETYITDVPKEVVLAYFMESDRQKDMHTVYTWVKDVLMPSIPSNLRLPSLFIKNGTFSNKYDFATCCVGYSALEIARAMLEINYTAFMCGAYGNAEIAIRKRIPFHAGATPCIYNGMPLRCEYRVFYDFDQKKALDIVNYWDWDYCYEEISSNATDKIVFEAVYPKLKERYEERKDEIFKYVEQHMQNVTELNGIWSIDIMETEQGPWLIDMALGEMSAYWDPNRVNQQLE